VTATAFWFGPSTRPVFGWLHLPEDGQASGVVVLCPTMGLEAVYSYRALRELAELLADAGLAALRFDYDSTGNSAGGRADAGGVAGYLESTGAAIAFAEQLGLGHVAVVGLRLGAVFAAIELAKRGMVDDLVLWDPCASGRSFLREQRALWGFLQAQAIEWGILQEGDSWGLADPRDSGQDGSVETPGLVFGAADAAALEALSIASTEGVLAKRTLLLLRKSRKPDTRMVERLGTADVETEEAAGQEDLLAVSAVTPRETVERIVAWLAPSGAETVFVSPPTVGSATVGQGQGGRAILERPVELGPHRLFGVLTELDGASRSAKPTVVFLNAGRINHMGPGRLWVELARSWAAQGFRCLRLDLSGIGDSPTRPGRTTQIEYPTDAMVDLADALEAVAPLRADKVVLVGLCSGAYHAIECALTQTVDSICLVNPILTFFGTSEIPPGRFEPQETEERADRQATLSARRWTQALGRLGALRGLLHRLPDDAWWIVHRLFVKSPPVRTFQRLARREVDVFVVAGPGETRKLLRGERWAFRSLSRSGGFSIKTVPHLEHSLLERTGRERAAELLTAHVLQRFGTSDGRDGSLQDRVTS
jgi:alpha-beta hydrolase superfamily lysophospholipase